MSEELVAICPVDGVVYSREWDLDHEEHDPDHPNHYKYCDLGDEPHEHDADGHLADMTIDFGPLPPQTLEGINS